MNVASLLNSSHRKNEGEKMATLNAKEVMKKGSNLKRLTGKGHDSGNCRLYVEDEEKGKYVILDGGEVMVQYGQPRFVLHDYSRDGEPCSPINCDWILEEGVAGTIFEAGLKGAGHLD